MFLSPNVAPSCAAVLCQVVNRLRKAHVLDIIREYGEDYDHIWIYSKIHHEMNQLCSKSTLQEIYIDKFDEIDEILQAALQVCVASSACVGFRNVLFLVLPA